MTSFDYANTLSIEQGWLSKAFQSLSNCSGSFTRLPATSITQPTLRRVWQNVPKISPSRQDSNSLIP
ncbi:MAG: hypothetical protein KME19_06365 [Microcoleus vaginatus WJT46-NPBG5]|nr:hypothetical protein [Microcoleus vaginatus WJT46-NPBG5]